MSARRFFVRIWVPDRPGVLGAVATGIGTIGGNLIGLEVLEREGGVAVDELTVELPDDELVDEMCRQIQRVEGAGVEVVHPVPPGAEERGLQVMAAAVAIMETANSSAALAALMGYARDLFDLDWVALLDPRDRSAPRTSGEAPPVPWLLAFANGAQAGTGEGPTDRSGALVEQLETARLTLCVGRAMPFRRRERREIQLLARVTDRAWAALEPARLAHPSW